MPVYRQFKLRHPSYDADYWRRCCALYAGGKKLLADDEVMKDIFPPHNRERADVYNERRRRAFYVAYPGEIIDYILAGLAASPLEMEADPEEDEFYDEFFADTSKPGGERVSMHRLLRDQLLTALICKTAWTLIELPKRLPDSPAPETLAEEDAAGYRRAYACEVDPACVIDWEEDNAGELIWAMTLVVSRRRADLNADRGTVREEYTYYSGTAWERYVYEYRQDKPPRDEDPPTSSENGTHSFGRVPLVRLSLPDGLWAMGKLEPLARAHLNQRNALSWAQFKSLFPFLGAFLAPPSPLAPKSEDDNRAVNQTVGQGYVWQGDKEDRLEYIGPDSAPFAVAAQDLKDLRDEMHRVLHAMAQSVDNSGAALQRSAESKAIDQVSASVVLGALGELLREHAVSIVQMVERGRKDTPVNWSAHGYENFDEISVGDLVNEATSLEVVSIPSATFQIKYKYQLAKRILGAEATEEDLETIETELEQNIVNEQFAAPAINPTPDPNAADSADPAPIRDMNKETP